MKLINIKDARRVGQTIVPESSDKIYVFDVAGSNNDQNWVNVKVTFQNNSYAALFLQSGDIFDLDTANGRITKLEAYYQMTFRVVE